MTCGCLYQRFFFNPLVRGAASHLRSAYRYILLYAWLLLKLWMSTYGHASLLGRMGGFYLVVDSPENDEPGNALDGLAGVVGHGLLGKRICAAWMYL